MKQKQIVNGYDEGRACPASSNNNIGGFMNEIQVNNLLKIIRYLHTFERRTTCWINYGFGIDQDKNRYLSIRIFNPDTMLHDGSREYHIDVSLLNEATVVKAIKKEILELQRRYKK